MNLEADPSPEFVSGRSVQIPSSSGFCADAYSRRYTGISYFVAAAAMFFPLQILALYAIATGPTQTVGFTITTFAITIGMGAAGAAAFLVKGRRKRGVSSRFTSMGCVSRSRRRRRRCFFSRR